MLTTYEQVYKRYLEEAKKLNGRILKTDAHNEAKIYPVSLPIVPELEDCHCIEFDDTVLKLAMENFPKCNIESGDIRSIRYPVDYFDAVLDLSTIDHIHPDDVDTVLKEYRRVCKPGGDIVIVVWIGDMEIKGEWKPQDQYFFNFDWFNKLIADMFKIMSREVIFVEGDKELYLYKLKNETINNHPPV